MTLSGSGRAGPKAFPAPYSMLQRAQKPFKMRQLKQMPLAVSSPIEPLPAQAPALPRLRLSKLCIAVQGATPAELFSRAEDARKDSGFIEFRIDALAKPAA